jgi:hypothetical protein
LEWLFLFEQRRFGEEGKMKLLRTTALAASLTAAVVASLACPAKAWDGPGWVSSFGYDNDAVFHHPLTRFGYDNDAGFHHPPTRFGYDNDAGFRHPLTRFGYDNDAVFRYPPTHFGYVNSD